MLWPICECRVLSWPTVLVDFAGCPCDHGALMESSPALGDAAAGCTLARLADIRVRQSRGHCYSKLLSSSDLSQLPSRRCDSLAFAFDFNSNVDQPRLAGPGQLYKQRQAIWEQPLGTTQRPVLQIAPSCPLSLREQMSSISAEFLQSSRA